MTIVKLHIWLFYLSFFNSSSIGYSLLKHSGCLHRINHTISAENQLFNASIFVLITAVTLIWQIDMEL